MKDIICTTQAELNAVSTDFEGKIIIKFGTPYNRAEVKRRFKRPVEVWGKSSVEAWGKSSVVACGNSSVVARQNSSVVAWGKSSVEAWDNSQICVMSQAVQLSVNGNAREIWASESIESYAQHHGCYIDSVAQTVTLYKAVHKRDGKYISDWDNSSTYEIGETMFPHDFCNLKSELYGAGIHLAHMACAVAFGANWSDLAILECECKCDEVLVPKFNDGKVRAKSAKVLREVPLEECGQYGKILAMRRK